MRRPFVHQAFRLQLVPERHPLRHRRDIGPDHSRQAADPFGPDRVHLVRHRGRALLPGRERLGELAHLRPLAVPDLKRDRLAGGGEQR